MWRWKQGNNRRKSQPQRHSWRERRTRVVGGDCCRRPTYWWTWLWRKAQAVGAYVIIIPSILPTLQLGFPAANTSGGTATGMLLNLVIVQRHHNPGHHQSSLKICARSAPWRTAGLCLCLCALRSPSRRRRSRRSWKLDLASARPCFSASVSGTS